MGHLYNIKVIMIIMARLTLDDVKRRVEAQKPKEFSKRDDLDYIVFKSDGDGEAHNDSHFDEAEDDLIRHVRNITDQDALMSIFYKSDSYEIRYEVLNGLADENLDEISRNTDDEHILEWIEDIKFERGLKRKKVFGLG